MKLIKEYKNEEIPEAYLIMFRCNTIFMSIQFYCIDILFKNKELIVSEYKSFLFFLIILAITINILIFVITVLRYSIIKYHKNIINNIENIYLRNIEYMVIINCIMLIVNLIIIKSI